MNNIKERIQKLMDLANNNSNEFEAEQAMAKARKMMIDYHIEQHELENDRDSLDIIEFVINQISYPMTGHHWRIKLGKLIADNHKVEMLHYRVSGTTHPIIIGDKTDVEVMTDMYIFANNVINRNAKRLRAQYRRNNLSTKGVTLGYALGFIEGLEKLYEEQNREYEAEGNALVLAKDPELIDYIENEVPTTTTRHRQSRASNSINAHSFEQGKTDGQNFNKTAENRLR